MIAIHLLFIKGRFEDMTWTVLENSLLWQSSSVAIVAWLIKNIKLRTCLWNLRIVKYCRWKLYKFGSNYEIITRRNFLHGCFDQIKRNKQWIKTINFFVWEEGQPIGQPEVSIHRSIDTWGLWEFTGNQEK